MSCLLICCFGLISTSDLVPMLPPGNAVRDALRRLRLGPVRASNTNPRRQDVTTDNRRRSVANRIPTEDSYALPTFFERSEAHLVPTVLRGNAVFDAPRRHFVAPIHRLGTLPISDLRLFPVPIEVQRRRRGASKTAFLRRTWERDSSEMWVSHSGGPWEGVHYPETLFKQVLKPFRPLQERNNHPKSLTHQHQVFCGSDRHHDVRHPSQSGVVTARYWSEQRVSRIASPASR